MIGKNRKPPIKIWNLIVVFFVFGAIWLGCTNSNFSVGTPPVSDSEAETIATKTLQSFNRAVQKGDFQEFQQTEVAGSEKANLTTEKFNQTFAGFVRNRIDITPKSGANITWLPKQKMDGQYLNIYGNYPAASGKNVAFTLQYVRDGDKWGLKYIDINVS